MKQQQGQALVEGLIVLLCLLTLWVGGTWLLRLQDVALHGQHATRFGAFTLARGGDLSEDRVTPRFFVAPHAGWRNRHGGALVPPGQVHMATSRLEPLGPQGQPGASERHASRLRQEWKLQDTGIARVSLDISPQAGTAAAERLANTERADTGLRFVDTIALLLRRHTAILTDAGHSADAQEAHKRAAGSDSAWRQAARASYAAAERIAATAIPVDSPWDRARPVLDWFMPWVGKKP